MKRLIAAMILAVELISPARGAAAGPTTYTVEPFDFDGVMGITMTVTQLQFGGRYCPCVKIPYPADGMHNQQGADTIAAVAPTMKPGDTLMGFSLGVQVISLFLSKHTLPAGVHVVLAGDTETRNNSFLASGVGIPVGIANDVTAVANEFDGWSDTPTITTAAGYGLAWITAGAGTQLLHYYANADPTNSANIVYQRGNIRYVLIPTMHLPQNAYLRAVGLGPTQATEDAQHTQINTAYVRTGSTPARRAAAAAQQVPFPPPAWVNTGEPVAAIP
jgi:hypothetical protein